jgi:DNA-binding response OmpR family regulator
MSLGAMSNAVVVVSVNTTLRALLELTAEEEGLMSLFFDQAQAGLNFLKENTPCLIVLDEGIDVDPFTIASRLKMSRRLREVPVAMLIGDNDERTRLTAEISRVDHIFNKPVDRRRLSSLLRSLPTPMAQPTMDGSV